MIYQWENLQSQKFDVWLFHDVRKRKQRYLSYMFEKNKNMSRGKTVERPSNAAERPIIINKMERPK